MLWQSLITYPLASLLFFLIWGARFFWNLRRRVYPYDTCALLFAALFAFTTYFITVYICSWGSNPYERVMLIALAVFLANCFFLYFTSNNFVSKIANSYVEHKERKSLISLMAATEAIITLSAFCTFMQHPFALWQGLQSSVADYFTDKSGAFINTILLALLALRFFYVMYRGSYRVLFFWLSFIVFTCIGIFAALGIAIIVGIPLEVTTFINGSLAAQAQAPASHSHLILLNLLPYLPVILLSSLTLTIICNSRFFHRPDSLQINFSSVWAYLGRSLGGLLEPLCLICLAYTLLLFFSAY